MVRIYVIIKLVINKEDNNLRPRTIMLKIKIIFLFFHVNLL